jgi:hypothetical protein
MTEQVSAAMKAKCTRSAGYNRPLTAFVLALAGMSTSCSDARTIEATGASGDLIASTAVPSGDDYFTLVGYLDSLEDEDAQLSDVTEHGGFAGLLWSSNVPNAYFVGSGESPTIQRFDKVDGKVVAGESLSFAKLGLTYAPGSTETAFDEDGFAYSVSVDQSLLIVWDTERMQIDRTIELETLPREGFASVYPLSTILRDGKVLFPVSFTNWETGATLPLTVLVSVDLLSDEVELFEDKRCSGIRGFAKATDGTLYGATDGFFAVRRRLYGENAGTEPCVLRILPGETRFDPEYALESRQLFDTSIVGDVSISADGESVLFNAFDEEAAPIAEDAVYSDVAAAAGWRVYRAPIEALTKSSGERGEPVSGLSLSARQGLRFTIKSRSWLVIAASDYTSSQLFDVTSGRAVEGPEFTGSLSDLYAL